MSYIAVNEVKSTTIKTGKGGARPCNPNIRATLFSRGLWSKLESKGSLGCGRFRRLGSLSSGRYVLRVLVGLFFSCREILNHLPANTRPWSPLFWFRSHHIYPGKRLITVPLLFIADHVWPRSAMVWPWCMTMVCYQLLTMVHCQSWLQNKSMFFAKSMTTNNKTSYVCVINSKITLFLRKWTRSSQ